LNVRIVSQEQNILKSLEFMSKQSYRIPKNGIGLTHIDIWDDFVELFICNSKGETTIYIDQTMIDPIMEIFTDDPEKESRIVTGTRIPYPNPLKIK